MKLVKKSIILTMIMLIVLSILISTCSLGVSKTDIQGFSGSLANVSDAQNTVSNVLNGLISATRIIGAAVAIIILIVIACKYIIASAGDRADIKKYAMNYIIGAVILFAATGILGIIQTFVNEATGGAAGGNNT